MYLARVQNFSTLRQNITNLWNFKHAYPWHPGALQKTSYLNNTYNSYQSIFLDLDNVNITQNTL